MTFDEWRDHVDDNCRTLCRCAGVALAGIATLMLVLWLTGAEIGPLWPFCMSAHGAEPIRKPTLWIAIDESPRSQMLKAELTRRWDRPHSGVHLNRQQRQQFDYVAHSMTGLQLDINRTFRVCFVDRDVVPMPVRLHLPAVRIDRRSSLQPRNNAAPNCRMVQKPLRRTLRPRVSQSDGTVELWMH